MREVRRVGGTSNATRSVSLCFYIRKAVDGAEFHSKCAVYLELHCGASFDLSPFVSQDRRRKMNPTSANHPTGAETMGSNINNFSHRHKTTIILWLSNQLLATIVISKGWTARAADRRSPGWAKNSEAPSMTLF